VGLSVSGFVLILILLSGMRYFRNQNRSLRIRQEEVKDFLEGIPNFSSEKETSAYTAAQNQPYDENYEIDLMKMNIGEFCFMLHGEIIKVC